MIAVDLIIFFFLIIITSISISGYGSLIETRVEKNLCINIFFGFVIVSLIVTILHFFLKLDLILNSIILIIGIFLFYKNNKFLDFKLIKKNYIYLFFILFLIPLYISQKYNEDFGYYHLPYALALFEEKIIFGFANIDKPFVYNSLWLNLQSIFLLGKDNYDFLTLPSFLLFLFFIFFSINKILKKKAYRNSCYFLIISTFYFLLKFTRISEFGVDVPATIFSVLAIFYFLSFFETENDIEKREFFYLNFIFSIFSILIKLSTIPVIILTIYLFFFNFKKFRFVIFELKFLVIYFLCFVFFIQQFIYTGCFFFPTNLTCLKVSWFNFDHLNLSKELELVNKSYSVAKDIFLPEEYLNNFNWFIFWIKRNFIEIIENLLTLIFPILILLPFLERAKTKHNLFNKKLLLAIFVLFSLIFWLNFSPVFRFGIHIFITLVFLIFISFLDKRKFSKKKIIIFFSIFLLFNFSKNIFRLSDAERIFVGIQKIDNKYILSQKNANNIVKIYQPDTKNNSKNGWQGRLCWNIPFICSYNKLDVRKKNGYLMINKLSN